MAGIRYSLPSTMNEKTVGQIGYEAYATNTSGKTFDGRDMPKWAALPERVKNAWEAAADAIGIECSARNAPAAS